MDADSSPALPTIMRQFLITLEVINRMSPDKQRLQQTWNRWKHQADRLINHQPRGRIGNTSEQQAGLAVRSPESGRLVVLPRVEGRIVRV